MLISAPIVKATVLGIISPHGVTDLVHAAQSHRVKKLFQIQAANVLGNQLLHSANLGSIVNAIFFISSAIHFRHDFNLLNKIPNAFIILLFFNIPEMILNLFLFGFPNITVEDAFFLYMTFIHVPNHYRMSWSFIKKQKVLSGFLVFLLGATFLYLGKFINYTNVNPAIKIAVKSFIISHIMYNELYIHKTVPVIR
jgi:hypothetical protein